APAQHLIFVGHSLGAALAVLGASRVLGDQALQNLAIKPQTVCTFGIPRVGSASFAQAFNQTLAGCTIRFVPGEARIVAAREHAGWCALPSARSEPASKCTG